MIKLEAPSEIGWLFLDLNSYFASVEQQCRPELRGKPVAVVPLETDATCAIAASYEAKAHGIKTGTRIYEAKKILPELVCVLADHGRYVEFHHKILAEIERHIPITNIASIDEVACKLDRSQRNPQQAIALAKRIKQGIYNNVGEAIHCSIGIAPNRFLAKVATEIEKPNGLVVVEPHDIPAKITPLELRDIPGIGRSIEKRLHDNNIFSLEELYTLPPKHMRAIWHNVAGEKMWYKLRGIELEDEETQKRNVGHSHMLAPENRPLPQARIVSQRLLLKAASRLRRYGYHAANLVVSARLEQGRRIAKELSFPAVNDNESLLKYWNMAWNEMTASAADKTRFKKVSITLSKLIESSKVQTDLFDFAAANETHKRNEKLSSVLDQLNEKYGRNTITSASTLGKANDVTGTKIAFSRIPEKEEFHE